MKKTILISISALLLLALLGGCGEQKATDGNVIKIGIFEPASGDNGAGGKQEALGIYYANFETPTVEIDGVTYTIKLVGADNQSSTEKAPSAAQALIAEDCVLVLGSYGSGVSIAASDVFADAGMPVIGVTCTNPAVTLGNSHYFRICFLDPFQGTVLANFAAEEFGAKKAYVLAKQGDDYSVGLSNYFMEKFGKDACFYETFPEGTSDFSSYISSAKAHGVDVFFSPVSTEAAALIIDQAATQGLDAPILAGDTWDSNVILNAAKDTSVKVFVTTFYQEGGAPKFDDGIRNWLNSNPNQKADNGGDDKIAAVSAMGYDAYYLALAALTKAGSPDRAAIMDILPGLVYSDGVSGPISFDQNGDAVRDTAYIKVCDTQSGEWEFYALSTIK